MLRCDSAPRGKDLARHLLEVDASTYRWAATAVQANRRDRDTQPAPTGRALALRDGITSPVLIARRPRVNRAVVTGLLDRMEQRGLVRREADPMDRRRQRIVITPAGAAARRSNLAGADQRTDSATDLASTEDMAAAERTLTLLAQAIAALEAVTPVPTGALYR